MANLLTSSSDVQTFLAPLTNLNPAQARDRENHKDDNLALAEELHAHFTTRQRIGSGAVSTTTSNQASHAIAEEVLFHRSQLILASSLAGMGFGSAGVHLFHGMSYPLSTQAVDRTTNEHLHVPHGHSVCVSGAPILEFMFEETQRKGRAWSEEDEIIEQHIEEKYKLILETLSSQPFLPTVTEQDEGSLGQKVASLYTSFTHDRLCIPQGIAPLGLSAKDIPTLVQSTLPQRRVLDVAPMFVSVYFFL